MVCDGCGGDGGWADVEGEGEWITCDWCNGAGELKEPERHVAQCADVVCTGQCRDQP